MNPKETIRRALSRYRGDDLLRARAAFHGLTAEQMQAQHGQSGRTRAAILADYEQHESEVDAAVRYVEQLP